MSNQTHQIIESTIEESTGRNQILSFLHSGRRPRYIRPLAVLVRGFGFSGDSLSLNGDAETFLLVCGGGSESADE